MKPKFHDGQMFSAGIQAGDRDAFAKLLSENRARLLALAYRLTASSAEAEDVLQDAFVSTLRHHEQFKGQAQPSTWLYRVTFNAALMRLRTKRRKGADSLEAMPLRNAETAVHHARSGARRPDAPDAAGERKELGAALDDALATLRPLDRDIVRMRFTEGMSTDEVAEAVGLSNAAIKTRLHRARAVLRERLEADPRGVSP